MTTPEDPRPASERTEFDRTCEAVRLAEERVAATIDSLSPQDWAAPSLLPGWTRTHVAAHLALNAEGMARALDGVARRDPTPVYESVAARDADITRLATQPPGVIAERLSLARDTLLARFADVSADDLATTIERVPGVPFVPVASVPMLRRREVEIHHADLGAGYTFTDWPADFAATLVDQLHGDRNDLPDGPAFTAHATDLDQEWLFGGGGPVVSGSAAALGWWLAGRGAGDGLDSTGALPELGKWR